MSQEILIANSTTSVNSRVRCFLDISTMSSPTSGNTKISISLKVELSGKSGAHIGEWSEQGSVAKGTSTYIKVEATKGSLFNPEDSTGRPSISTNKDGNKEQTFYFSGKIPYIPVGIHTIKTCNFYLEHNNNGEGSINISSLWNVNSTWGGMVKPKIIDKPFNLETLNSKADFASSIPSKIYTSDNTNLEIQIKKPVNASSTSVSLTYGTTTLTPSSSAMTFSNWVWTIPASVYTKIPFSTAEKQKSLTLTITTNFYQGGSQSSSKSIALILSSKPTINSLSIDKLYHGNEEFSLTGTYGDSNKYRVINLPDNFKYSVNINATGSQDKNSSNPSTSNITEYKINNSSFTQDEKISLKTTNLTVSVKDERDITEEKTFDLSKIYNILEYIPVTKYLLESKGFFEVKNSGIENSEGTINTSKYNLKFNFSCNFFWGFFGEKNLNSYVTRIRVKPQYREKGTTNWLDVKDSNNNTVEKVDTYEGNDKGTGSENNIPYVKRVSGHEGQFNYLFSVLNVNITKAYEIQVGVVIEAVQSTNEAEQGIQIESYSFQIKQEEVKPIYDYDDRSFNFNIPVLFNTNRILWNGDDTTTLGLFMNKDQQITLSEKVSEQSNGIVLVFSFFDYKGTGKGLDWGFNTFFIHKDLVRLKPGVGSCFFMVADNFNHIGWKYLYISDNLIRGNKYNSTDPETVDLGKGTKNGITYNNNQFVLRYVFGV